MPGRYDIYVFGEDRAFYTRPPVVMVTGGEGATVWIRNLTEYPIVVSFPHGVIERSHIPPLSRGYDPAERVEVGVGANDQQQFRLNPDADGIFEYNVDVQLAPTISVRAPGNSWPKIIVDP